MSEENAEDSKRGFEACTAATLKRCSRYKTPIWSRTP